MIYTNFNTDKRTQTAQPTCIHFLPRATRCYPACPACPGPCVSVERLLCKLSMYIRCKLFWPMQRWMGRVRDVLPHGLRVQKLDATGEFYIIPTSQIPMSLLRGLACQTVMKPLSSSKLPSSHPPMKQQVKHGQSWFASFQRDRRNTKDIMDMCLNLQTFHRHCHHVLP